MTPFLTAESLGTPEFSAVAALWKRERRRLVTSFSGSSMVPAIRPGQEVVVECGADPEVGEVALFRLGSRIGVHRVVARGGDWLLTWGDANALPDEAVPRTEVIGVLRDVPRIRPRLQRTLLLLACARSAAPREAVSARIRRLHRVREAIARGPAAFLSLAFRAIARRLRPGRGN